MRQTPMIDLPDPKAVLRKTAFAARKAAHAATNVIETTERANQALLEEIGPLSGHVIAGYMPIRTEIDPLPAMMALAQMNRVCVPVIAGAGLPLGFREWSPEVEMVDGPFGARVPAEGDWLVPDTLIVPLVAFDGACNRLGYGGGFYDRTLEELRAQAPTRAIGFAFSAQRLPQLPVEPTDQPLDALVTEADLIRP